MTALIIGFLVKQLKKRVKEEVLRNTPIGGTVDIKGVAHGIKMFGGKWEVALVVLKRTD